MTMTALNLLYSRFIHVNICVSSNLIFSVLVQQWSLYRLLYTLIMCFLSPSLELVQLMCVN
jgi:hypothetical protein